MQLYKFKHKRFNPKIAEIISYVMKRKGVDLIKNLRIFVDYETLF